MTASPSTRRIYSSKRNPCPICGRSKDESCSVRADGALLSCHYGNTHHPPEGLKKGDVIDGTDGQRWAYTGDASDGRTATFTLDKPRDSTWSNVVSIDRRRVTPAAPKRAPAPLPSTITLAKLPQPAEASSSPYGYSEGQQARRTDRPDGSKTFLPQHLAGSQWIAGAGPDPWPAWQEAEAINHGGGAWVLELEGEKCAGIARSGGLVAISQPGHAHKVEQIQPRYARLHGAGVAGIVFLADHDAQGEIRAKKASEAAAAVGLPLLVLAAVSVWPNLPAGGSIDDAPGTPADRIAAIEAAIPGVLEQQAPEPPECIAAEARAIAAEVDRQEIGQCLSLSYLLPAAIAHAVEVRTRYQPTDGPSAALPFLAGIAGLLKLGTRIEASAVAGYIVPVNLFACLVGKSGAMKSPVGSLLVSTPTAPLRQELAAAHEHALETWREQCREKKKEDRPLPPRAGRIVVSDYTGEALAAQLQEQEKRGAGLLIHRDELSGLFGSLNQYRSGKGGDEQQLLELYDGNGLTSLRVVGDRHYSRSQVSIYGGTQPDVLRDLVADGDASGLWARFLFVPLPARVVPLPLDTTPAEVAAVEAAADTLKDVCRKAYAMPPRTYRLCREAAVAFREYHANRQRSAQYTIIGAQSAIYGKSAGKVLRVAGVLHVLAIAAGEAQPADLIGAGIIERATALVDHLDAWALSFHAEVAAGGVPDLMRNLHTIALAAAAPVTWRDVSRKLSRKQREGVGPDEGRAAMQELARMGYGEVQTVGRSIAYRATGELP